MRRSRLQRMISQIEFYGDPFFLFCGEEFSRFISRLINRAATLSFSSFFSPFRFARFSSDTHPPFALRLALSSLRNEATESQSTESRAYCFSKHSPPPLSLFCLTSASDGPTSRSRARASRALPAQLSFVISFQSSLYMMIGNSTSL